MEKKEQPNTKHSVAQVADGDGQSGNKGKKRFHGACPKHTLRGMKHEEEGNEKVEFGAMYIKRYLEAINEITSSKNKLNNSSFGVRARIFCGKWTQKGTRRGRGVQQRSVHASHSPRFLRQKHC